MRLIIAVLEDMEIRIDWLKANFPSVDVVWSKTVDEFLSSLKAIDLNNLALIILDHDLGGPFFGSYDDSGKNGMDAVQGLDASMLNGEIPIPVVIWSINTDAAKEMVKKLQEKKVIAAWIPFTDENKISKLAAAISSQVN